MATILFVDDMGAARIALRRIVERAGFDVRNAPDPGWDAPEPRASSAARDIAVQTVMERGGAGLIADLQSEMPDIKVVAISTQDGELEEPSGAQGGDYPFSLALAQLPRTVEKVLHHWH